MPTYQYACKDCGNQFEQVQAFSDPSLTVCPTCGGSLRKVYGSVGVVFKGSGFYRTDSRSGSGSASLAAGSKGEGSKGEGSKGEGSKGEGSSAAPAAGAPSSPAAKVAASSGSSAPAKAAS